MGGFVDPHYFMMRGNREMTIIKIITYYVHLLRSRSVKRKV